MKLSLRQFLRHLPFCGWLLVSLLFAGCSHLYYADPNPATPFVFPGQSPPPPVFGQTPVAPTAPTLAPVGVAPIAPAAPGPQLESISEKPRVGDAITVSFSDIPPPGMQPVIQRIGNDGQITLPFNVKVIAAGKPLGQLQDDIRSAYVPKYFVQMTCSVISEERVFFVEGEVKQPSRLPYKAEMTVLRAITSAGGFTDFAQRKKIQLRRPTVQKFINNSHK